MDFVYFPEIFPGFPGDFWAPCELSKTIFRHLSSMHLGFILDGFGVLLVLIGNRRGGPSFGVCWVMLTFD